VLLYLLDDVPPEAFQEALWLAWSHDHHWVRDAAGSDARLRAMFRRGGAPLPDGMPDTVRIWRGVQRLTLPEAVIGPSWTLNRDIACWFAMRRGPSNALVVAADVKASDLLHYDNSRSEEEVICFRPPNAFVDGSPADWMAGFLRFEENIRMDRFIFSGGQG
jgi:hypothetical protein